jgi:SAM-dependent methyltransferase
MKRISRIVKVVKKILYSVGLFNLVSKLQNRNFAILKNGYVPKRFWDNWSEIYYSQPFRRLTDVSHEDLLKVIRELNQERILEVGCGFGRNLKFILKNLEGKHSLFGADLSESFLKKAVKYVNGKVDLVCADIIQLPLADNSFDFVFTYGTLMHVSSDNVSRAVSELKRVCSRDLVIIEEVMVGVPGKKNKLNDYTFIHQYKEIFDAAGFEVKEAKIYNDFIDLLYMHCRKK